MKTANITIDSSLKAICEKASLGVLFYEAFVEKSGKELTSFFENTISALAGKYTLEDISRIPQIELTRSVYKALGKSPSEYRNASEAMLRRIVKQNGLYHINNIVEINNIISITSGYSVGSYDLDKISGDVIWKAADPDTHYEGIGKSSINIGRIPTLFDSEGPFGNPTSDSQRAMIQPGAHNIMSVIYSFDSAELLDRSIAEYKNILSEYCGVSVVNSCVIS